MHMCAGGIFMIVLIHNTQDNRMVLFCAVEIIIGREQRFVK